MEMAYVTIIAMLALVQYSFFSFKVGQARGKYDVEAPATSGHEIFDRVFRVHQNTLEQLITFISAQVLVLGAIVGAVLRIM